MPTRHERLVSCSWLCILFPRLLMHLNRCRSEYCPLGTTSGTCDSAVSMSVQRPTSTSATDRLPSTIGNSYCPGPPFSSSNTLAHRQ
ncbi:hypothetical protein QBC46DRAFT_379968 [Diplogelasinospora grovesii]|uniref:Secreted protein n=1 Tax=Diplogelasinospora grovesii TaxID=303347 RepID=A0AAN6S6M6_9PEZI|nr:hypothetical protein QBC46DRAFT_379968 [Diplogelasinospora grovesii]